MTVVSVAVNTTSPTKWNMKISMSCIQGEIYNRIFLIFLAVITIKWLKTLQNSGKEHKMPQDSRKLHKKAHFGTKWNEIGKK